MPKNIISVGSLGYPAGTPLEQVLKEIVQAGYQGTPVYPGLGPPEKVKETLERFGLKPAPGYQDGRIWLPQERSSFLETARKNAQFERAMGLTEIFIATAGWGNYTGRRGLNRAQVAGWVSPEDSLTAEEWQVAATTLAEACRIYQEEGVSPCFHSHVGSVVETLDEIERLLTEMPPDLLYLGPDTGHLAFAGIDPVEFFRKYASLIRAVHLKDVLEAVRTRGAAEHWDYDTFIRQEIYTELGRGNVNFERIFDILKQVGYSGALVVETDAPSVPTMLESNTLSRQYLRKLLGY